MLVCVTGGNGFLASHIVDQLLDAGHRVRATVRNSRDANKVGHLLGLAQAKKCPQRLELFDADLTKSGSFDAAFRGVDTVVHVAMPVTMTARNPQKEIVDPALQGVGNVISALEKSADTVKRLVFTGSTECVGTTRQALQNARHTFTERDFNEDVDLSNAYSLAKVLAERKVVESFEKRASLAHIQLIVLLPSWIAGPVLNPRPPVPVSLEILLGVSSGEYYPIVPDLYVQVVDVRDCARVHVNAAVGEVAHLDRIERIAVASSAVLSVLEICLRLRSMFPQFLFSSVIGPHFLLYIASLWDARLSRGFLRDNLGVRHCVDNAKSIRLLGAEYRSENDTLREGMQALIDLGLHHQKYPKLIVGCIVAIIAITALLARFFLK